MPMPNKFPELSAPFRLKLPEFLEAIRTGFFGRILINIDTKFGHQNSNNQLKIPVKTNFSILLLMTKTMKNYTFFTWNENSLFNIHQKKKF